MFQKGGCYGGKLIHEKVVAMAEILKRVLANVVWLKFLKNLSLWPKFLKEVVALAEIPMKNGCSG